MPRVVITVTTIVTIIVTVANFIFLETIATASTIIITFAVTVVTIIIETNLIGEYAFETH